MSKVDYNELRAEVNQFEDATISLLNQCRDMYEIVPHPYLKMILDHGEVIEVEKISACEELEGIVSAFLEMNGVRRNGCYFAAYELMDFIDSCEVKYVEGVVKTHYGTMMPHAWVSFNGRYFDLMNEVNAHFIQEAIPNASKPESLGEYVKLIEMKKSDFKRCLGKHGAPWRGRPPVYPPYAAKVHGLPHLREDIYDVSGSYQEVLMVLRMQYDFDFNGGR